MTEEESPEAIDHIIALHESYDPERIYLSCQRPLQQADGRFLPARFDVQKQKAISTSKSPNETKGASQILIEMSS